MIGQVIGVLFSDKIRGLAVGLLLTAILAAVVGGWFYPKQPTIGEETLTTLKEVSLQIKKTADALVEQSSVTTQLNKRLSEQLSEMEKGRNESYKVLMDRYGVGDTPLDPKTLNYRNFLNDPDAIDRMFEENNNTRSTDVPGSPVNKN